jgi:hypothetical protein
MRGDSEISRNNPSVVDSEGYSIRPENDDPFKMNCDDLENSSKFRVEIQKQVIEEDAESTKFALDTVAAQLQSEASSLRRVPRTRTGSGNSSVFGKPDAISPKHFTTALAPIQSEMFEDPTIMPQYSMHVIETVNVQMNDHIVEKIMITGELKITVTHTGLPTPSKCQFQIHNSSLLEKIVLNQSFVKHGDGEGAFELLMPAFSHYIHKEIPILKYQLLVPNADDVLPFRFKPMWKFAPSEANLLVQVCPKKQFVETFEASELHLVISVDAKEPVMVQTKPASSWDAELKTLLWELSGTDDQYFVAKLGTANLTPLNSSLRFKLKGGSVSRIHISATELTKYSSTVESGVYDAFNQLVQ